MWLGASVRPLGLKSQCSATTQPCDLGATYQILLCLSFLIYIMGITVTTSYM